MQQTQNNDVNASLKIVSLLPSCTEIVYSLGLGNNLCGVSHECDFPQAAKTKPVLTKSKIDANKRSDVIDDDVTRIMKQGLSVYDVDIATLRKINPDVILTQDQCEVCAVSLKDVESATKQLVCNAQVMAVNPKSINDILNDVINIGKLTGSLQKAEVIVNELQQRIKFVQDKTGNLQKPRVCCVEWIKPLILAGNWAPEMVDIAGGINCGSDKGMSSQKHSFDDLLSLSPDIIVIVPCGFKIEQTIKDMFLLTSNNQWNELKAVQSKQVYIVDGNAYFNRPGPRIVDSIEILAQIIHPELFNFGYKSNDFVKFV